jgi:Kef-type K+ transport system membrane component KefB
MPLATRHKGKHDRIRDSHASGRRRASASFVHLPILDPLSQLLLQLITILVAARIVGALFARAGQPAVIGEMTAGILLGPSLFGWLAPAIFRRVFPFGSLSALELLSQIGVCLFLFVVGMSVDVSHVKQKASAAVAISLSSIVFPAMLGAAMAIALFSSYAGGRANGLSFALFMAISMSITAFPVLARILDERKMTSTPLGTMALTCAAMNDVTAWGLLAVIVAITNADGMTGPFGTLVLVGVFVAIMLRIVRPLLPLWLDDVAPDSKSARPGVLVASFLLMLVSALATDLIGIHALFGAFLAGVVMPRAGRVRQQLSVRIEDFSTLFLLPLFFVFTGLRTSLNLLNDVQSWIMCLGIIAVAITGKLGGTFVAARWTGLSSPDAFALGALMNTRGLMELIALNIGYDLGILSPRIFSMLVLMALVTTALTGPLLGAADRWRVSTRS